ncbi:hypothetical protein Cob_v005679 [Colletotrichum orbiculare MAFF 240422]|uniref:Uncharacterized protein n=1 Tax=Colletotrichum orbiculare (strain 104-T / ATCC 96160 / CBS 514.97 / LARS 414 / MAFF 240422) TaxID=1213857 RepID=A0A484FSR5_COLOR|nr:hypothetical protein Cob_v005679 [Colletotrichum orbiculare MAFF 240422]
MGFLRRVFGFASGASSNTSADGMFSFQCKDTTATFDKMARDVSKPMKQAPKARPNKLGTQRRAKHGLLASERDPQAKSKPVVSATTPERLGAINAQKIQRVEPRKSARVHSVSDSHECRLEDNKPTKITSGKNAIRGLETKRGVSDISGAYKKNTTSTGRVIAPFAGRTKVPVLKTKPKISGLSQLYKSDEQRVKSEGDHLIGHTTRPIDTRRIRSVSVSQVSHSSASSHEEPVLVTFPSFCLANAPGIKIDAILDYEDKLAKYRDADENDEEWGLDGDDLQNDNWARGGHENIVSHDTYVAQSVIREIYEDLPTQAGKATTTKSARNLLFSNYGDGTYKKIAPQTGPQTKTTHKNWGINIHSFIRLLRVQEKLIANLLCLPQLLRHLLIAELQRVSKTCTPTAASSLSCNIPEDHCPELSFGAIKRQLHEES